MSRYDQDVLDVLTVVKAELTTMATAFRELGHSRVLETASFTFNAAGMIYREYQVPYNAVHVVNQSNFRATLANAPLAAATPTQGQGVVIIGGRSNEVYNIAGRSLSLYGNPGDQVTITVFATPQAPGGSSGTVSLAGSATVTGTVTEQAPATADIYTEAPASRTTNGNTANLTWPANVAQGFVGVNITGFAGGTNVVISLQQQDANGIFQTIASTAALTATGTAVLAVGPGQTNGVLLRSGGTYRLAWTVTGVFTTLTFQLGVTAR